MIGKIIKKEVIKNMRTIVPKIAETFIRNRDIFCMFTIQNY